jgi:putative transposase
MLGPWWAENFKEAYSSSLYALARAFKGSSSRAMAQRAGIPLGFPGSKEELTGKPPGDRGQLGRRRRRLPRIGVHRTKDPTIKPVRGLEARTARVLAVSVSG